MDNKIKKIYHAAIYVRLSKEDGDVSDAVKAESNSISNQKSLIRDFLRGKEDIVVVSERVDDGYSGSNFERPSFQLMMENIKKGIVDCIVVKDLFRFGREYIDSGRYLECLFPALGVRFIAINDNYDSLDRKDPSDEIMLPFKNLMNDAYCRDISIKIRSHLEVKRRKGEFTGAFVPYGYKKDACNKNKIVTDPFAAGVVKDIFRFKLHGFSNDAIAAKLNAQGILSPMEYKKSQGEKFSTGFVTHVRARWSAVAVKRILTNELYTGMMVQGKNEKVSHKVKRSVEKPKEEWVRVPDTHEAVVSAEDFETVQKLLAVDTRASAGKAGCHMFMGFLFCGDCGEPMIRRINRYKGTEKVYFICPTRNKGLGCTRHSIPEEELKHLVLAGLQQQLALFLDKSHVLTQIETMEVQFDEVAAFDKEIRKLHQEQEKYVSLRSGLYEDLKQGIITEEDFRDFRQIYEKTVSGGRGCNQAAGGGN